MNVATRELPPDHAPPERSSTVQPQREPRACAKRQKLKAATALAAPHKIAPTTTQASHGATCPEVYLATSWRAVHVALAQRVPHPIKRTRCASFWWWRGAKLTAFVHTQQKSDITVRHQHPKFGTSQGTLSDSKGRKNTGNGPLSSASYNYFLPFTGFNTLKLHMRVSSMLIMAPALSNSPQ